MADTKISEMTAATSLADADLVPVVQGGVNKRGTVDLILDGITAARVNTALGYTAANDAALNATNLTSGTVPDARFPATLPAASGVNLTNLVATNIATGLVPTARLGGGTASSSTYLRGDQTWATVTSGVDGSGTANQIPTWSDTDTLAGSKMTASGTNGGTWALYDDTATTGVTTLVVRAGANQGITNPAFQVFANNGSTNWFKVQFDGAGPYTEISDVSAYRVGTATFWSANPRLASNRAIGWGSTTNVFSTGPDVALARSAAGIIKVTDGSTGQGGIGIADSATNTVSDALILRHATSGTAAASFGTGLLFQGSNSAGTMHSIGALNAYWDNPTDGAEDTAFVFRGHLGGVLKDLLHISANYGLSGFTGIYSNNRLFVQGATELTLQSLGNVKLSTDGVPAQTWELMAADGAFEPGKNAQMDIGDSTHVVRDIYVEDVLTSHVKMGPSYSSFDAGVTRSSAGVLKATDGSTGFGSLRAANLGVETDNGAIGNVQTISESITLSTSGLTTDSTADLLPANSIILAVTARVTTTITTTTDWALGDAATSNRFAAPNATLTAGTTTVGLRHQQGSVTTDAAGPVQTSAAKLRITCTGANPGAGVIRVTVTYLSLTPPTS